MRTKDFAGIRIPKNGNSCVEGHVADGTLVFISHRIIFFLVSSQVSYLNYTDRSSLLQFLAFILGLLAIGS